MAEIICQGVRFAAIEAVIFDKDGTLADSHQYLHHLGKKRAECIAAIAPNLKDAVLEAFGFEQGRLDPAGFLARSTREEDESVIASLMIQAGYPSSEASAIVQAAFRSADQQLPRKATLTPLFPGVIELIQSFSSLKLGILTSDSEANLQEFINCYQLSSCFQGNVGAQAGISKPNPQLLSLICEVLNVDPEATLVIGDTIADTQLTRRSIGVTWGGSTIAQLAGAAAIAHQPAEIRLL
ncbi:MAG TPA: HAD family hydrolase [Leptolyngbya sp.]|jgi:phosphoglycolate phosphatase|nr:HAD family hydrolase [Leptolyngbya sp.]